jgi:hypothetical protein
VPFAASPLPGRLVLCAGTPEPDGFDCRHGGSASVVTVQESGDCSVESVRTGRFRFAEEAVSVRTRADLDALASRFPPEEAARTLLRVTLAGTLPGEEHAAVEEIRRDLASRLLHLDWRAQGLRREIDAAAIDAEFPAGSFPHALLSALAAREDGPAIRAAFEIMEEARP